MLNRETNVVPSSQWQFPQKPQFGMDTMHFGGVISANISDENWGLVMTGPAAASTNLATGKCGMLLLGSLVASLVKWNALGCGWI